MSREPHGLVARIRDMRRALATPDVLSQLRRGPAGASDPALPDNLQQNLQPRVAHLEQLVLGLQDSVYRESQRQDRRITELEARVEPTALTAALDKDARERGL
jgi:hypothetical protein